MKAKDCEVRGIDHQFAAFSLELGPDGEVSNNLNKWGGVQG